MPAREYTILPDQIRAYINKSNTTNDNTSLQLTDTKLTGPHGLKPLFPRLQGRERVNPKLFHDQDPRAQRSLRFSD